MPLRSRRPVVLALASMVSSDGSNVPPRLIFKDCSEPIYPNKAVFYILDPSYRVYSIWEFYLYQLTLKQL